MILTPIPTDRLSAVLDLFAAGLHSSLGRAVFRRIAVPANAERATGAVAVGHRKEALDLAASFAMGIMPGAPAEGFSWDGRALRANTEAYILIHEIAHFQLAAPSRRLVIDFGLGSGPETGDREGAENAMQLGGLQREWEEATASLLGILWEVELGHPALASFLDQNWLEGVGRPAAAAHFEDILMRLRAAGFVDGDGHPTRQLRQEPDDLPADRCHLSLGEPATRSGEVNMDGKAALEGRRLPAPQQAADP